MTTRPFSVLFSMVLCLSVVLADDILLKCDESDSNHENPNIFCTVRGFKVTYNNNVKIINDPETMFFKFMKFYDSRLLHLPFKLFDHFPNLRALDVSFTEIVDIQRNAFVSADNLSFLDMSNNNITTIENSVFNGAISLTRIDLSWNLIETINEFAFHGLTKIDKIVLSNNKIKALSKDIFLDNKYLATVSLENNRIASLDPEVFSRLGWIQEVNLANNRLIQLNPNTFQSSYEMETLHLNGNQLKNFSLTNQSVSLRLNLDNNYLTSLVINSTKFVTAENNSISSVTVLNGNLMEKLILGKNNFTDISNIANLTTLLVLDLSHNNIGPMNITSFDKLHRLKELYLRGTNISKISFGMFSKQTSLETLDLSFNNITDLNLNIFIPHLSKIRNFYIDGNNLTEIHGKWTFAYAFPGLAKIGLSKNQFNCSYLHSILSPPFLSSFVELHIEPESSIEESTHIRDITCVSTKHGEFNHIQTDTDLQNLRKTIAQLKNDGQRLEVYLLVFKILMVIIIGVSVIVMIVKYAKWKRSRFSGQYGRNGTIVFRSNATMNSATEPDIMM